MFRIRFRKGLAAIADVAAADEVAGLLIVASRPLLCTRLNNAIVLAGRLDHPLPFPDEQVERLFDVNVLSRRARHDRHKGMPVIGGRNDDGVNVLVFEQLSKVANLLRARTAGGGALLQTRLVHVAQRDQVADVLERLPQGVHLQLFDLLAHALALSDQLSALSSQRSAVSFPESGLHGSG